jgi:hypothetical protein
MNLASYAVSLINIIIRDERAADKTKQIFARDRKCYIIISAVPELGIF